MSVFVPDSLGEIDGVVFCNHRDGGISGAFTTILGGNQYEIAERVSATKALASVFCRCWFSEARLR
jgi:hypothetical protein